MLNLLLTFIRIRYAKSRMVAYVNGELSPAARRRIGRYLDLYPSVYAEYLKQRAAAHDLQWRVPLVGYPEKPTLDRMWAAIQTEMHLNTGDAVPSLRQPNLRQRPQQRYILGILRLRYGVLGLAFAFVLVLPFTLHGEKAAFAHSLSQPAPQTIEAQPTDTLIAESRLGVGVGMVIQTLTTTRLSARRELQITPPPPALPQATPVSTDG